MAHDGPVDERSEVVLVVSRRDPPASSGFETVIQAATGLAGKAMSQVESTVGVVLGAALDRVVPITMNAVLDRVDLTALVLQRVDLREVVQRTIEELDLTDVVLTRVDVDAIVAKADLDAIIDRLPLLELANYIIDEIDLPSIIRDSTGGIASDAINAARMQSAEVDQLVNGIIDRILLRRRQRRIDAPGTPESLAAEAADGLQ